MNTEKKGLTSFLSTLHGGGEENRTPVRKFIHIGISECSLSFPFPYPVADKQAKGLGILLYIVHAGGTLRRRSPLIDARIRIRGPIRPDGCLIKQPSGRIGPRIRMRASMSGERRRKVPPAWTMYRRIPSPLACLSATG